MTDLNANALEQDADDGDCSHACRAAQELLNRSWLFVPSVYARLWRAGGSHPGGRGSRRHCGPRPYRPSPTSRHQRRAQPRATVRPGYFDSRPSDPVASSASFLGHCSAAAASATSCFGARVHEFHEYFVKSTRYEGTKVYGRNRP